MTTAGMVVEGLRAGYGRAEVLHGLDLEVRPGSVAVLLGANGAGKTTTLRAISGLLPARGRVELDGQSLLGRPTESLLRRGVAHVPQGRGTFTDLTVEENLRIGAHTRKDRAVGADIDHWYDTFPLLRERRSQVAGSLSGGEQQMLALARALMARPRLLLLDEPSLGLAPLVTQQIFEVLGRINVELGMAMLLVEQNATLALRIAERVYLMESGRIVLAGDAAEVAADDSIRRAYLGY